MRFRKLPVEVGARRWDGTEAGAEMLCRWANDGRAPEEDVWMDYVTEEGQPVELLCHTLEGPLNVSKGDWIIRGVKGEFYPCKPDVFERTYEPVTSLNATEVHPKGGGADHA